MPAKKAKATSATKAKAKAGKPAKAAAKTVAKKPARLAKADRAAPVQAYIASLEGYQKALAKRIDAIITREVPNVRKAVKWHSPLYGVEGLGWFASMGSFQNYLKLNFFNGGSLNPVPPSGSSKTMRALDIREDDNFDEKRITSWVQQASSLPGWGTV